MAEKKGYECEICGHKEIATGSTIPECCGIKMKRVPLEVCMKPPADAESARTMDDDGACDDFRGS